MPFELPPWLQETSKPFQSFAQGAQVGLAMGRSYAQARQFQQSLDLQHKQLARADASRSLAYAIKATKFIQDQQDYRALEQFTPLVFSATTFDELSKFKVPMLHDTQNYLKLSALLDRRKTEKAMGEMAGELATTTDWADPKIYQILNRYAQKAPDITLEPVYNHLVGRHQAAVTAKTRLEEPTNKFQESAEMAKLLAEANAAYAAGDRELGDRKKAQAEYFTPPGWGFETFTDAGGNNQIRATYGKPAGALTTATQGQVQQRLIGFEKSMGTAAQLYSKLSPEMLGVQGLLGELAVDKGLAQQFPELANKERINGRTLLRIFNEQIIKSLKVDAQVNKDEEKRLLAALPQPGAMSSLPEAKEKIRTFMGVIRDQARVDAQKSGTAIPNWALTLDELVIKVEETKELTREQAIQLIEKYGITE